MYACVFCQLLNLFNDWEWTTYFADYGKSQSSFVRVTPADCIVILEKSDAQLLLTCKVNPLKLKDRMSTGYILPSRSNVTFLISDIRALWHSGLSARVPECQKLKMLG